MMGWVYFPSCGCCIVSNRCFMAQCQCAFGHGPLPPASVLMTLLPQGDVACLKCAFLALCLCFRYEKMGLF